MKKLHETEEEHSQIARIRSQYIVLACFLMDVLLEIWIWLTIDSSAICASLTGAIIICTLSAFIAGNTFGLRDWRRRNGIQGRAGARDKVEVLRSQPPRETIQRRFSIASWGAKLGALAIAAAIVFAAVGGEDVEQSIIASILILICALLCFVSGSYARPID
ncbi:hypothetical protein [Parafrankia sp. BMG5.11]|uniref:hypothetical protein n=1 Tax=Parafrankia sp. BMG5.11 TaxID=222540 RepID=UPI0010395AF8|nr:hypothetical protein [Parafrankia sp. BMG5.11]TCJ35202.1 hypothetical protein E0504_29375 [Parafrankia sp. BMG5.11]